MFEAQQNVFLIGNGESRKNFDLNTLRPHGKIYGCNRLYQDFTPDVLISVDHGIMHEIYQSGYCVNNEAWFRDWTKVPLMSYESLVKGALSDTEVDKLKENGHLKLYEVPGASEYVYHGSKLEGMVKILKENEKNEDKQVKVGTVHLSQIHPNDKSNSLSDIMQPRDRGWSAGPTAGYIACKQNEVLNAFLIGHDLNSTTPHVNNLYKDTKHYVTSSHHPTPSVNWITQWKELFDEFKVVMFYKVNEFGVTRNDTVNQEVQEWSGVMNLDYIDYEKMQLILSNQH